MSEKRNALHFCSHEMKIKKTRSRIIRENPFWQRFVVFIWFLHSIRNFCCICFSFVFRLHSSFQCILIFPSVSINLFEAIFPHIEKSGERAIEKNIVIKLMCVSAFARHLPEWHALYVAENSTKARCFGSAFLHLFLFTSWRCAFIVVNAQHFPSVIFVVIEYVFLMKKIHRVFAYFCVHFFGKKINKNENGNDFGK